jgi:hypothetical protein
MLKKWYSVKLDAKTPGKKRVEVPALGKIFDVSQKDESKFDYPIAHVEIDENTARQLVKTGFVVNELKSAEAKKAASSGPLKTQTKAETKAAAEKAK